MCHVDVHKGHGPMVGDDMKTPLVCSSLFCILYIVYRLLAQSVSTEVAEPLCR